VPWFLNSSVSSVAHRSGKEISALDITFALIDEYIAADPTVTFTFYLQQGRGPYIGDNRVRRSSRRAEGQTAGSGRMVGNTEVIIVLM
jgi:hypothetical protein